MTTLPELEQRVERLKRTIQANHGKNVANTEFVQEVDALLSLFYDDIGQITRVGLPNLFDLFLIKTLYVNHNSTDSYVLGYLSGMLTSFLFARDLFPLVREGNRRSAFLLSDLLEEMQNMQHFQNRFEAYRKMGDYSLFITGVFPASFRRRRGGSRRYGAAASASLVDVNYHAGMGRRYYQWASEHELAEATEQRPVLEKLAHHFDVYRDALNETSDQYILGFDMNLIADKLLDNFNLYRRTGDAQYLENARKYAALLKVDRAAFPSLWKIKRGRGKILGEG
ncbi:MAG: hypothetical protein NTZ05_13900 [Chloroflexi bacterium]|nr:hypothetical protein [Chloroflexota bacterium]